MVLLDSAGLAIASADAVVSIIVAWKRRRNAHEQIRRLLEDSRKRVLRIQTSIRKYGVAASESSKISRDVFERVAQDFEEIKLELELLQSKLKSKSNFKRWLSSESSIATLNSILSRVIPLENHLELVGLLVHARDTTCVHMADLATRLDALAGNNGVRYRGVGETSEDSDSTETPGKTGPNTSDGDTGQERRRKESFDKLSCKVFDGRWLVGRKIGAGSFADVYAAIDMKSGEAAAVKVEPLDRPYPQLFYESRVYKYLNQSGPWPMVGIPRYLVFGIDEGHNFMVMDMLGPSLEDHLNQCCRSMSVKSVLMIGLQALRRVEFVHSRGFIHRDLKPTNFLMGIGDEDKTLFLVDYGLAKRFRDPVTHRHISYREGKSMVGTARYASINTHHGCEQSRRDDLESLGYMLVYLAKGVLPWQGLNIEDKDEKYLVIQKMKQAMVFGDLCEDVPREFLEYFRYVKELDFEERPDYSHLRGLFRSALDRRGLIDDGVFDWMEVPGDVRATTTIVAHR